MNDADLPSPTRDTVPPPSEPLSTSADPEPFVAGAFDSGVVGEASGVAPSVRNPGWVYVLDDGPGTDGVVAVDTRHGDQVRVRVEGLLGRDTEGLATGRCDTDGGHCLYIGDIGNNQRLWPSVDVWRVREPRLDGGRDRVRVDGERATYTYPDAPADAEALLVADGRPFLVTKERRDPSSGRAPPPRLLAAPGWGDGTLRDLGPIDLPEPSPGLAAAIVGNVVTGGGSDDGRVVLRTYDHVVEYVPPTPDAPLGTLPSWTPREVDGVPALQQAEGLAVDRCGLWLVSERDRLPPDGDDIGDGDAEQGDSAQRGPPRAPLWLVPRSTVRSDDEEQACPTGDAPS